VDTLSHRPFTRPGNTALPGLPRNAARWLNPWAGASCSPFRYLRIAAAETERLPRARTQRRDGYAIRVGLSRRSQMDGELT